MCIEKIIESIDSRAELLTRLSDDIWGYAETSFREKRSAAALISVLEQEGFTVKRGVGGIETAFSAAYGHGKPVIGILGEFDALFDLSQVAGITQKKSVGEGLSGHGCGHNLLGVGALAAALAVKDQLKKSEADGTVIYYGCPGEEGGSGKTFMARDGVFDILDAAVTWHPESNNVATSTSSLANIEVKFRFYGVSSHAAKCPENGRSALDAVELLNIGVQFLREHIPSSARVHYAITNAGGRSPNVVQQFSEVLYLCRAAENKQAREIYDWVLDIARGAALMTHTRMEYEFIKACSNIVNNVALETALYDSMNEIPLPEYTEAELKLAGEFNASVSSCEHEGQPLNRSLIPYFPFDKALNASTDVGDVSWVCPTAQIYAVTYSADTPLHSWQAVAQGKTSFAHKGMLYAGKVLAATVEKLMSDRKLLDSVKAEFCDTTAGNGYVCPIPPEVKPQLN